MMSRVTRLAMRSGGGWRGGELDTAYLSGLSGLSGLAGLGAGAGAGAGRLRGGTAGGGEGASGGGKEEAEEAVFLEEVERRGGLLDEGRE